MPHRPFLIGGRTQSADDLGFSHILLLPPTTTSHSLFCGRLSAVIQAAARGQREKSHAVVQKQKSSAVQNFFHLLLYPLGYNRARKNSSCAAIFLAAKMPLTRNNAATNKNAKKLRRIVNEMTNILVKMTDICGKAKKLASGTGFAYNDK